MTKAEPTIDALRAAIQWACQPQTASKIVARRNQVLAMPQDWVLVHFEQVVTESLNLADYWEYRRMLELANLLDASMVQRLIPLGLGSGDPDVREAAEDFQVR